MNLEIFQTYALKVLVTLSVPSLPTSDHRLNLVVLRYDQASSQALCRDREWARARVSQPVIPDILAQLHTAPVKGKRGYLARRVGVSSMDMNAIEVRRKNGLENCWAYSQQPI